MVVDDTFFNANGNLSLNFQYKMENGYRLDIGDSVGDNLCYMVATKRKLDEASWKTIISFLIKRSYEYQFYWCRRAESSIDTLTKALWFTEIQNINRIVVCMVDRKTITRRPESYTENHILCNVQDMLIKRSNIVFYFDKHVPAFFRTISFSQFAIFKCDHTGIKL